MNKFDSLKTQEMANIIILNCTYADRHKVQKLGAKWNNRWRAWCIDDKQDMNIFAKWLRKGSYPYDNLSNP